MPKNTFVRKAALEKLPLAVRKDLRDNFELEKSSFEGKIAEKLGISSFTINFNMNEVWACNTKGSSSAAGGMMKQYVEGFIYALDRYVEEYDGDGKLHFNEAVTKSELGLAVNELGDQADAISAEIKSGVFRILFGQNRLGYNQSYLPDPLLRAIESVPREGFSLVAKNSILKFWTEEIDDLGAEIGEIIAMKDVVLDPNFAANYAVLDKGKETKDWQADFGRATFQYFSDGLKYQLGRQGFKGDDMLQEGLAEVITTKTFKPRVVQVTKNNATNEVVIENGIVYIQTTPVNWWYNVSDATSGLLDLL